MKQSFKHFIALGLFACIFLVSSIGQEAVPEDPSDSLDIDMDALFDEDSEYQDFSEEDADAVKDAPEPQEQSGVPVKSKDVDLLNDVISQNSYSLNGNFRFVGGYSTGWDYMPWNPGINDNNDLESMALMDMRSSISLDFQIGPEFRVLQKYSLSFPNMETDVTEFFCDFNVENAVFIRMGRQTVTWGISRNYPFTNLTARVPEDFGDRSTDSDLSEADSYALKINVPVNIGGVEGIIFTRNGFFEDSNSPSPDEIGYGGNFNIANSKFDLTLGTFYHSQMNLRAFYSLSSTIFKNIEIYQEGLVAYDIQGDDLQPDRTNRFSLVDVYYQYPVSQDTYSYSPLKSDRLDISLNLGFLMDFLNKKLKVSGEYFYCGEETELDIKNSQFPLMWGHNIAFMGSYRTAKDKLNLFTQFKYNTMENSGLVIPGLTLDTVPYLTLNMAFPIVFGDLDGGYNVYNPDNQDRPVSFILSAVISGKV